MHALNPKMWFTQRQLGAALWNHWKPLVIFLAFTFLHALLLPTVSWLWHDCMNTAQNKQHTKSEPISWRNACWEKVQEQEDGDRWWKEAYGEGKEKDKDTESKFLCFALMNPIETPGRGVRHRKYCVSKRTKTNELRSIKQVHPNAREGEGKGRIDDNNAEGSVILASLHRGQSTWFCVVEQNWGCQICNTKCANWL